MAKHSNRRSRSVANQYADDSQYADLPPLPKGDLVALYRLARIGQAAARWTQEREKNAELVKADAAALEKRKEERRARSTAMWRADRAVYTHAERLRAIGALLQMATNASPTLSPDAAYSIGEMVRDSADHIDAAVREAIEARVERINDDPATGSFATQSATA